VHELSVVQSLLDVALAEARRAGAARVTRLHCRIGELCQIDHRLLVEAFELLRPGTLCESAELHVEKTFLRAHCSRCGRDFDVRNWQWRCPGCGEEGSALGGGDELELTSIEAETEE
jgi:hydrogenase nickel incorporation protein HypA/HybF